MCQLFAQGSLKFSKLLCIESRCIAGYSIPECLRIEIVTYESGHRTREFVKKLRVSLNKKGFLRVEKTL